MFGDFWDNTQFWVLLSIEDDAFSEKGGMLWSSFVVVFDIIIIRIFDDSSVCSSRDLRFIMFGFENQG